MGVRESETRETDMKVEIRKPSHTRQVDRAIKLAEQYRTTNQHSVRAAEILARYQRIVARLGYDPIN